MKKIAKVIEVGFAIVGGIVTVSCVINMIANGPKKATQFFKDSAKFGMDYRF